MLKYLSFCSVGIVPYSITPYNTSSFPLKIFEYLAAGLPVVSTALPAAEWVQSKHVHLAKNTQEFLSKVNRVCSAGRSEESIKECQELARKNDWSIRAEVLEHLLYSSNS